jgi:PD-(D/E)XK endonuclease
MNTNEVGARTEGVVLGALLRAGYAVLIPFGTLRYDLAIDTGDDIKRVQCKTGRLTPDGDAIKFGVRSNQPDGRKVHYRGQADYFGVYCHAVGDCYQVPVDAVGINEALLRLTPARNGQQDRVRMAADCVITLS